MTQTQYADRYPRGISPASVFTGLLIGILTAVFAISYAFLIFAGPLTDAAPIGMGLTLLGTIVINLVVAWRGEVSGEVAKLQDIPVALLATLAAGLIARMPATATRDEQAMTVLALMVVTSIFVGVGFWIMGRVHLGNLVWYFPFPVTAGFLAGVGWLLIAGAFKLMTGLPLSFATLATLTAPEMLLRWAPGVLLGGALFYLTRRLRSPYTMPLTLLAAGALFYGILAASGISRELAQARGWLLGPFAPGILWTPPPLGTLRLVDWPALLASAGTIVTIFVVTLLGQLLDATGLEMTTDQPLNLNNELKINGIGNVLLGLAGSPPGHMSLSLSSLSILHGGLTRSTPLIAAGVCAALLIVGAPVLSIIPVFLLAGLVVSLGLSFLYTWLIEARRRVSRAEFLMILAIFAAIQFTGILPGVAFGLLLALLLFVVSYSRISVIKHTLDGTTFRSNVERPQQQVHQLAQYGREILILELQGFIFFGTVVTLQERIGRQLEAANDNLLQFVVLDFRQVQGFDASAVAGFAKLRATAARNQITLVLTDLTPELLTRLLGDVDLESTTLYQIMPDLDRGVEWCEDRLLQQLLPNDQPEVSQQETVFQNLQLGLAAREQLDRYLERRTYAPGDYLIRQGTSTSGIVFILSGSASVQLEYEDRHAIRVRKAGAGAVFGEMSTYAGTLTSAAVIAEEETTAYVLSPAGLAALENDDPATAVKFHQAMAALMGERLAEATASIQALLR